MPRLVLVYVFAKQGEVTLPPVRLSIRSACKQSGSLLGANSGECGSTLSFAE
jgi:hypothetical protein